MFPGAKNIIQEAMKMLKKIACILLYYFAAEIFSLFICLTLASSGSTPMRLLSTVFTLGVLASIMLSLGMKMAKEDKPESIYNTFINASVYKEILCIIPDVSWIVLLVSHFRGGSFYRIHKLLNGWFLPVFNIMQPGISSADLTGVQLFLMLLLADVPGWLLMAGYFYESRNYRKN